MKLFINKETIKSERAEVMKKCHAGLDVNITLFLRFKAACKNVKEVTEDLIFFMPLDAFMEKF